MSKFNWVILLFVLFFYSYSSYAQCVNNTLDLGADTTLCDGDSLTISAGPSFIGYIWNTLDVDSTLTVGTTGAYSCTRYMFDTTNLVNNGDFSLGNTGFTSSYIYGTGGTWGLLSNPGQYAVSTNANLTHNNFVNCTDHTTGTGNYMICNGASTANTDFWCQTITVSPSTTYIFSGWFTSVVSSNPAIMNFKVDGSTFGNSFSLSTTTCSWQQYYQIWTSGPAQTSATICLTNQNIAGGGNDFAVDDISFTQLCTSTDTIQVTFNSIPVVNLGNDTVICPGSSLALDITDSVGYTYLWSDGSTSPLKSITNTDSTLWAQVSNGGCVGEDSLIVTSSPFPQLDLGDDSILCPGDTLALDAYWPQSTYLWQNNSTDSSFTITQPGTYWVAVTDQCGTNSDTVIANYVSFPLVDLGSDTNLCDGDTLPYDITISNGSYLWSDNSTSPLYDITTTGTYSVGVTLDYCTDYDTVSVVFNPTPNVNLGNDTTLCQGESIVLDSPNTNSTYLWQNNSTNPIFFVNSPGTYWVEVTRINCVSSDTINISFIPLPIPNIGNDTAVCDGDTVILNAYNPNSTYLWQDSSVDSLFQITQAGSYWVAVTNSCATVAETLNVAYNAIPEVNIGGDTTICNGDVLNLDATTSNASYIWSDNSTKSNLQVNQAGVYSVSVTVSGCTGEESIEVDVVDLPPVFLGNDTAICSNVNFYLDASSPNAQYMWQDNSTLPTYKVNETGMYSVHVISGECQTSDSINVEVLDCEVIVTMPNIFTPNDDMINDTFKPILISGVNNLHFQIFNRWGEEVFSTDNPLIEWSGNDEKGNELAAGVYYWVVIAQGLDLKQYEFKGNVTILR